MKNEAEEGFIHFYHLDKDGNTIYKGIFFAVIDFLTLGTPDMDFCEMVMMSKCKQKLILFKYPSLVKTEHSLGGTISKMYSTPFNLGYGILYRNVMNQLKFSASCFSEDMYDFKNVTKNTLRLDYNTREIEIKPSRINGKIVFGISMVDKFLVTDENLNLISNLALPLPTSLEIVNSWLWLDDIIVFTKGNFVYYWHIKCQTAEKVLSLNWHENVVLAVLADRLLVATKIKGETKLISPHVSALEMVARSLIGSENLNEDKLNVVLTKLHTNQFSEQLVERMKRKGLYEQVWLLVDDSKSVYGNVVSKIELMNNLLNYEKLLDILLPNLDQKSGVS